MCLVSCEVCDADAACEPSGRLGRVLIRALEIEREGQQLFLEKQPTFRVESKKRKDTVDVFWQENVGQERWMGEIRPGGHYYTETWTGSVFLVRARDGKSGAKARKGVDAASQATADGTVLLVKTIPNNKDLVVSV